MIKDNAERLKRQMRPQDFLTIVTFSDRAEVVLPPMSVRNIGLLDHYLNRVTTGGGTEIFRGLEAGVQMLDSVTSGSMIRHLILLTDGHTYGDEEACLKLARDAAKKGISLSALGIGSDWNDEFLDRLTGFSGGNSTYISSEEVLTGFLSKKMGQLGKVFANHIQFELNENSLAEINFAFRLHPDEGSIQIENPLMLGNLLRGSSLSVILEFRVANIKEDVNEICLANGQINLGLIDAVGQVIHFPINWMLPVADNNIVYKVPSAIVEALSHLTFYRLEEEARRDIQEGNMSRAKTRLLNLASNLLACGEENLAHTVMQEVDHLDRSSKLSENGQKQIKYGTRALLKSSELECRQP